MTDKVPHGQPDNVNICVLDVDSDITGFGKHNRILVSLQHNGARKKITAREDILHNLNMSNDAQRRKVMNGWRRMHPKGTTLTYVGSSHPYMTSYGTSIDHEYVYS